MLYSIWQCLKLLSWNKHRFGNGLSSVYCDLIQKVDAFCCQMSQNSHLFNWLTLSKLPKNWLHGYVSQTIFCHKMNKLTKTTKHLIVFPLVDNRLENSTYFSRKIVQISNSCSWKHILNYKAVKVWASFYFWNVLFPLRWVICQHPNFFKEQKNPTDLSLVMVMTFFISFI